MQIRSSHIRFTQPFIVAFFVLLGSFLLTACFSRSFTPAKDSLATSDVNVELEDILSLAILDQDPTVSPSATVIDSLSMSVTPTPTGAFITNTAYIQASSNNATGYTLSFSDTDESTALSHQDPAVSATIPSITSASTSLTDISLNQWGYSFGDNSSAPALSTTFQPIPALSNPINLVSTVAPSSAIYPFTVATKINTATPAGTYTDTVVFSLVANHVPRTNIILDKNESSYNPATLVTGALLDDTGNDVTSGLDLDYNAKITLPTVASNTYARPGYRFLGWSEDATATTATYTDGDTLYYNDRTISGEVVSGMGSNSAVTLYAIWQPKNFPTSLTTMQDMTSEICADVYTPTASSTTIEAIKADGSNYYYSADNVAQTTLSDIRDDKAYNVRKLADGKCWMTSNLRITGTIQADASDFASGSFNIVTRAANPSPSSGGTNSSQIDISYTFVNSNPTYGNFYNWYTATAGGGTYSTIGAVDRSICPKNWRLPAADNSNDIPAAVKLYANLTNWHAAFDTVYAGQQYSSRNIVHHTGEYAIYWTNAAANNIRAHYTDASYGDSSGAMYKATGYPIRCVAR